MREPDPLSALLREWKPPEPPPELDGRMLSAYRDAVERGATRRPPVWAQFWRARISVPVPVLGLAVLATLAVFVWVRGTSGTTPAAPVPPYVVTQLNATGFQSLPDGAARVIPVSELQK